MPQPRQPKRRRPRGLSSVLRSIGGVPGLRSRDRPASVVACLLGDSSWEERAWAKREASDVDVAVAEAVAALGSTDVHLRCDRNRYCWDFPRESRRAQRFSREPRPFSISKAPLRWIVC